MKRLSIIVAMCCISMGLVGQLPPKKNSTQVRNVNVRQDVLSKKDNSSWWESQRSLQEHLAKEYGAPVQYETPTRHRGIPSEFSGGLPTMEISKYNKGVSALHVGSPFYSSQEDDNTSIILIAVGITVFICFFLVLIFGTKRRWEAGDDEKNME